MMIQKVVSRKSYVVSSLILFLLTTCHLLLTNCFAQSIPSSELISNAKQYDGRPVVYAGEVIGEVMARGGYAWINVNDGENAIGIWLPKGLAQEIDYAGSYKSIGDQVEINGIFYQACAQHGGDLDIHAQSLRKTARGRQIKERLNLSKRNFAFVCLGILAGIWVLTQLKRK